MRLLKQIKRPRRPLGRRRCKFFFFFFISYKFDHTEKYRRSRCSRGFGHDVAEIGKLGDGDVEGRGEEYEKDHGDGGCGGRR